MREAGYVEGSEGVATWDFSVMLGEFGKYWDLNRPVLFEKSPNEMMQVDVVRENLKSVKIPEIMEQQGIKQLKRAYIILWRPICLTSISSHALKDLDQVGPEEIARRERFDMKQMVRNYEYLKARGEPVLVVSLADLMWNPSRNLQRLEQFLPCLGKLDLNFVPKMGEDVVEGNSWKADGSVSSFGASIDPSPFYNVAKQECVPEADLFLALPQIIEQEDAHEAAAKLQSLS